MTVSISEKQLKKIVAESVRAALKVELARLRSFLIPVVSESEQKDIERLYRRPSRKAAKTYRATL